MSNELREAVSRRFDAVVIQLQKELEAAGYEEGQIKEAIAIELASRSLHTRQIPVSVASDEANNSSTAIVGGLRQERKK